MITTSEKPATANVTEDSTALLPIRILILFFIAGLIISGATAIPLQTELRLLSSWMDANSLFAPWIFKVRDGLIETNTKYPFLAYGTDWLAFAHFVLAILFIGPVRNPVKNIWVIEFGMVACLLVVPFAFLMGGLRGIPFGWRLIDCSFGIVGVIPLYLCRNYILKLAEQIPSVSETPGRREL